VCTDFLKLVAAYLILKKGGIILHGSAVFNQGESLVFLAPSGGGKSTIASLLKNQWRLFNDECNAVLPVDSGFQIHAMPFARPENLPRCNPGSAMLKKIFILEQAENNSVRPLSLSQRVAGILANIYLNPISEELEETMLRTIEAIAQSIPVEILAFKNTPAIASDITHFL
jgi:ABC-type dipeptide/oligopeptide/nickel transport system ATPase subunit